MSKLDTKENRKKQFQRGVKDAKTKGRVKGQSSEFGDDHPNLKAAYNFGWDSTKGNPVVPARPTFTTSGRYYELKYFSELKPSEREELDYVKEDTNSFFRYKGQVYDLGEFARIIPPEHLAQEHHPMCMRDYHGHFDDWDCYMSDSFSAGIVVRYKRDADGDFDPEFIVIGTYHV